MKLTVAGKILLVFVLTLEQFSFADTYFLKDGSRVIGDKVREDDKVVVVKTMRFGEVRLFKNEIDKVESTTPASEKEVKESIKQIPLGELVSELLKPFNNGDKNIPTLAVMPFRTESAKLEREKIGFGEPAITFYY